MNTQILTDNKITLIGSFLYKDIDIQIHLKANSETFYRDKRRFFYFENGE